jgi:hypothetical protein
MEFDNPKEDDQEIVLNMREIQILIQLIDYKLERFCTAMQTDPNVIENNLVRPIKEAKEYVKKWLKYHDEETKHSN